ncbi:MAG: hypothetical protein IH792_04390 [Thaumarchaeota archaeon]|nr:hypothetical protein [Nitrososphaerota archaeon]
MSEKRNDFQELRELRRLRDMYQTRVDSKFDWSEGKKDKSLIKHYQDVLDYIKIKITKLENN